MLNITLIFISYCFRRTDLEKLVAQQNITFKQFEEHLQKVSLEEIFIAIILNYERSYGIHKYCFSGGEDGVRSLW